MGRKYVTDSEPEFHIREWDESIHHGELLEIVNKQRNYLRYGPMREEAFDSVFASIPDPTQDLKIIETQNGEIVGFVSLHQSRFTNSLVIWDAFLLEHFQSRLPDLVIQQAIALGIRRNLSCLKYSTTGPLCKPIDDALEKLGYIPHQISLQLHLTDYETFNQNFSTQNANDDITVSKRNAIADYEQFAWVHNKAFEGSFDYKEMTRDRIIRGEEHNRARGELNYFFAYENVKENGANKQNKMIGYCIVIFDVKDSTGFITGLAVLPEFQNRGIGSELLTHAVHYLRQKKCEKIKLSVWKDENQLLTLYTQFGFKVQPEFSTCVYNLLSINSKT